MAPYKFITYLLKNNTLCQSDRSWNKLGEKLSQIVDNNRV